MTEERLREIEVDISKREWAPCARSISHDDAAMIRSLIDEVRRLLRVGQETIAELRAEIRRLKAQSGGFVNMNSFDRRSEE